MDNDEWRVPFPAAGWKLDREKHILQLMHHNKSVCVCVCGLSMGTDCIPAIHHLMISNHQFPRMQPLTYDALEPRYLDPDIRGLTGLVIGIRKYPRHEGKSVLLQRSNQGFKVTQVLKNLFTSTTWKQHSELFGRRSKVLPRWTFTPPASTTRQHLMHEMKSGEAQPRYLSGL